MDGGERKLDWNLEQVNERRGSDMIGGEGERRKRREVEGGGEMSKRGEQVLKGRQRWTKGKEDGVEQVEERRGMEVIGDERRGRETKGGEGDGG
jgi:hypothetical protein